MNSEIFNQLKSQSFKNRFDTSETRIFKLKKLQAWIKKNESLICQAIYSDFKKPYFETVISETVIVLSELKFFIDHLNSWMRDQSVSTPMNLMGHKSRIRYENKGVVLIVCPWNYPFQLSINPLIAAVAAGNSVVMKPSELTPATSALIQQMCAEVFSATDVVVEMGAKEKTNELLQYQFDHVFFTGSTAVGKIIAVKCAEKLIPYTLELGGKSPVVITDSANIDDTISKIHWGKYLNRGQTCVAPDYILIDHRIKSDFINRFNIYKKSIQDNNAQKISDIISENHKQRLCQLNTTDFDFKTTDVALIETQDANHSLMSDEIFGPMSPIIGYENLQDATDIILKHPNPLAFYIFSENKSEIDFLLRSIPSGGVGINSISVHLANHNLPFGGRGNSGQGRYHGHFGFLEFSHHRAIINHFFMKNASQILFPPYTTQKNKLVRFIQRFIT
jgi:aldehyde dehydrogenase (NAD+)